MRVNGFLATTGDGMARAWRDPHGAWQVTNHLTGVQVTCLVADPYDPQVIYGGTQNQGVLRSPDAGKTWIMAGLEGEVIKSLAVDPHHPGVLLAGTRPADLFRTGDGGQTWEHLDGFRKIPNRWWWFSPSEKPYMAYVQAISFSPNQPGVILAGIEFGAVVRSEDGGENWSGHCDGALRDCHSLHFHNADGNWAYEGGGTGTGAAVSQDGGRTWRQPANGLDHHYGWAVAADPAKPQTWYLSASPQASLSTSWSPPAHIDGQAQAGIFRSMNGSSWERLNGGLPQPLDYMPYALLTHPEEPGCLYAGLSNGDIWRGADYGNSWTRVCNLGRVNRVMILLS